MDRPLIGDVVRLTGVVVDWNKDTITLRYRDLPGEIEDLGIPSPAHLPEYLLPTHEIQNNCPWRFPRPTDA